MKPSCTLQQLTRLELCTYVLYNSKGYIFEGAKSEVVLVQHTEVVSTHQTKEAVSLSSFQLWEVKLRYA